MNWLKKTIGICSLSLTILFSGTSSASSETLEIVFKNSVWGAAIGGVSGVAIWALQEDDKEDKFFPKYVVKGMAIGLFAGMAVGIFESQTDSGIFMSNGVPKENITMIDRKGVIYKGRDNLNHWKSAHAIKTKNRTLEQAIKGTDVFLGL